MSDWYERLRENITLTSPDGDEFTALFIGNDRDKEKKLGIFEYPDFDGTDIQDLGISGARYPLNIYFEGPDCDIEGQRFFSACDQRGRWSIVHPIYGDLTLQLVRVRDTTDLVRNGNYSVFETNWIEPVDNTTTQSTAQIGSAIDAQLIQANAAAADQLNANLSQLTAGDIIAAKSTTEQAVSKVDNNLKLLYENNDAIAADVAAIKRGITDTLDQAVLDPIVLAGQVQQFVQLASRSISDISTRLAVYEHIVTGLSAIDVGLADSEGKNSVSIIEIFMAAVAVVNAEVVSTGELQTQAQATEFANRINDTFQTITDYLDEVQSAFDDTDVDLQYFSQSQSYPDTYRITAQGIAYLLTSALDLATEKAFTLEKPRCPIEITVTEYGGLGDNDENLDFFIETNSLTGSDILLLPAGREVKVYV
jgi:prophage DNA circulation protein